MGTQILAEVSQVAKTLWITKNPPQFLSDNVDGRILFLRTTERLKAQQERKVIDLPLVGLRDILMIDLVKEACILNHLSPNSVIWPDGSE